MGLAVLHCPHRSALSTSGRGDQGDSRPGEQLSLGGKDPPCARACMRLCDWWGVVCVVARGRVCVTARRTASAQLGPVAAAPPDPLRGGSSPVGCRKGIEGGGRGQGEFGERGGGGTPGAGEELDHLALAGGVGDPADLDEVLARAWVGCAARRQRSAGRRGHRAKPGRRAGGVGKEQRARMSTVGIRGQRGLGTL
jgi:hypothetical protein